MIFTLSQFLISKEPSYRNQMSGKQKATRQKIRDKECMVTQKSDVYSYKKPYTFEPKCYKYVLVLFVFLSSIVLFARSIHKMIRF